MNARADRFPLVDSVRAIAALSILLFHAAFFTGILGAGGRSFVARLEVGVVIFLVISGFLLYRPFVLAHVTGGSPPRLASYAWRRFLRIVPAYWVALAVAAAVVPFSGVFTLKGIPSYFGFAQVYRSSTIGGADTPAWTLGLELSFYAMLPFWAMGVRALTARSGVSGFRTEAGCLAALWAASMAYKAALFATGTVSVIPSAPIPALAILPAYLDEFALGMGLAVGSVWLTTRPSARRDTAASLGGPDAAPGRTPAWRMLRVLHSQPGVAWVIALGAFVLVSVGIGLSGRAAQNYTPAQYLLRNVLYGVVALGIVLPAVFGDASQGLVRRLLAKRGLRWLGLISYGIYVWHWPVLLKIYFWGYGRASSTVVRYLEWATLPVIISVAIGAASYYLIERPALSLKRLVPRSGGPEGRHAPPA